MESIKDFIQTKETERVKEKELQEKLEKERADKIKDWMKSNPKPVPQKCKHGTVTEEYYVSGIQDFFWSYHILDCKACESERVAERLLKEAYIPERFADVPADTRVPIGSIMWSGGVGTGKTYKLVATMKALISRGNEVRFISWGSLVRKIRDSIQNGNYNELYTNILAQNYIVIDDLGTENTTDFICEFVYNLINDVYNFGDKKKLLLTTNLTGVALAQKYGDRTISRLTEMCEVVKMVGDDRRLRRI